MSEKGKERLNDIPQDTIRSVVFEGGGVLGSAYPSAVREFEKRGLLSDVVNFGGSSVGSMLAAMMACGASADYMEEKMNSKDFRDFKDDSWFVIRDLYRLNNKLGYHKGDELRNWFTEALDEVYGHGEVTLGDLASEGKRLVVTGTSYNTGRTIYFTPEGYPDMRVDEAVRISSSFPLFFQAMEADIAGRTHRLYDGGALDNYPIHIFDPIDPETGHKVPTKSTVGFKLMTRMEIHELKRGAPTFKDVNGAKQALFSILNAYQDQALRTHIRAEDWCRTVRIDVGDLSSMNFKITRAEKEMLKNNGTKAALKYLDAKGLLDTNGKIKLLSKSKSSAPGSGTDVKKLT